VDPASAAPATPAFEQPTSADKPGRGEVVLGVEAAGVPGIQIRVVFVDSLVIGPMNVVNGRSSLSRGSPIAATVYYPHHGRARFRNRPIRCLLDCGCERSIIGRRYFRGLRLRPTQYRLSAANKVSLPLDGDIDLHFTIDGHAMTASVSMSRAIDDMMLGSDWLVKNECHWDFAAGTIYDRLIRTYQRRHVDMCRRITVTEEFIVPPPYEANVPAIMMYDHIRSQAPAWVVELRVILPGVMAARTLVNGDSVDVVARVCNYSDTPHVFREDSFLGLVEPVETDAIDAGCDGTAGQCAFTAGHDVVSAGSGKNLPSPPGRPQSSHLTRLRSSTDRTFIDVFKPSSNASREDSSARRRKKKRRLGGDRQLAMVSDESSNDSHEHVRCLIERLPDDLTSKQRARAVEFIKSRSQVFSRSEFNIEGQVSSTEDRYVLGHVERVSVLQFL